MRVLCAVIAIVAVASVKLDGGAPPKRSLSESDYAVMSAALAHFSMLASERCVILPQTCSPPMAGDSANDLAYEIRGIEKLTRYQLAHQFLATSKLRLRFDPGRLQNDLRKYVPREDGVKRFHELVKHNSSIDAAKAAFPSATGFLEVSCPAVDTKKGHALLFVSLARGAIAHPIAPGFTWILVTRVDGEWSQVRSFGGFVE